jgi:hypoxia-inducible factor prolyl 4-hydroxylase
VIKFVSDLQQVDGFSQVLRFSPPVKHFFLNYFSQDITKQELFNLNQKCGAPGISVKAETGKAIIWYNHFVDPESGWLGEQDVHTYHGGCPVRKGEKWVANFWIKITK